MPEISITDNLGQPVDGVKADLRQPSSLADYAKAQTLHLLVAPDFIARKDQPLSHAAAPPIRFQAKLSNAFPLGKTQPEITLTPRVNAVLRANATAGAGLFEDDPFPQRAEIPAGAGYLGLTLVGALDLGVSGSAGDLTFGLDAGGNMSVEFLRAFSTGAHQPTLGEATAELLAGYLIPASVDDLRWLTMFDICTISGQGSLKVSGGFRIAAPVNPLASVNLPVGAGTLDVKSGLTAGVTASFTLSGGYQVRARRLASGAVELSYLRDRGTNWQADFSAAASLSASLNSVDLLAAVIGAISNKAPDSSLVGNLTPAEIKTFNAAIREGVAHSMQASLDLVLANATDDQAAFQYELELEALDEASAAAVNRALRGDLTGLTALENEAGAGDTIAPGIKLSDSLLTRVRTSGVTLKVNLLGIVNLLSVSKLMSDCEILFEPASGDLTIKETAQSERIGALTNEVHRQEALRKALFEAVLVTTAYRAGKAVALPELDCHCLHFVLNRDTTRANVGDYVNWFVALNLIPESDVPGILGKYGDDKNSTCVLRTAFDDAACERLFFDGGKLRDHSYYLEFGREALRAMLAPSVDVVDVVDVVAQARYLVLDEAARWASAVETGPSPALRNVIPLDEANAHFDITLDLVRGDVYDIVWWARSLCDAGETLNAMRQFLAGRDPAGLRDDAEFQRHRDALQKTMLNVVAESKARFDQPWAMAALYWAAGSPGTANGKATAGQWSVVRP